MGHCDLIFRPRLAANLGLAAVDALLSYAWASGADILAKLDLWIYETIHWAWALAFLATFTSACRRALC